MARGGTLDKKLVKELRLECDDATKTALERLLASADAAQRDEELRELQRQEATWYAHLEDEDERLEAEAYEAFVLREANWSLFTDLAPFVRPGPFAAGQQDLLLDGSAAGCPPSAREPR